MRRQLDRCRSIDRTARVVEVVGGRARIIVDGGISRGTDVVKALTSAPTRSSCGRALRLRARRAARRVWSDVRDPRRRDPHLPLAARVTGYHELDKS